MQDQNLDKLISLVPEEIPILPLRNTVAFPYIVMPLAVGIPRSVRLIEEAERGNRIIGLAAMQDPSVEVPDSSEVFETGTVAVIHRVMRGDDDTLTVFIQGLERIKIEQWTQEDPYLQAKIALDPDTVEDSIVEEALRRNLLDVAMELAELIPQFPDEAIQFIQQLEDPRLLVYLLASNMRVEMQEAQALLEMDRLSDKMGHLVRVLARELEVREIGQQIQEKAKEEIEKTQREYYLRQQMDAIREELGEDEDGRREAQEYREQIEECGMTEEAKEEAMRELARLEKMPPQAAEYWVIKTYLDWLISLPWEDTTDDNLNIDHARKVLDEDHYDLSDVKERILEFLAVRKLRKEREIEDEASLDLQGRKIEGTGAILVLVGPPGVGKTSLGQSVARALGRKFTRMSLGGMRDEAEFRGHRRTYIGAMPGRIMQAVKRIGVKNPVFMLDEVDKIGTDWRGDPASALLEVLDPQQNHAFRDHYLDVDFDLSQVLFICTANTTSTIPAPLLDRMEVIQIDGYTEYDKIHIAKQYLVPRQLKVNGLREEEIDFEEEAFQAIIRDYTREAGVRQLERRIGKVCRKVATKVAESQDEREEGAEAKEEEAEITTHVEVDEETARDFLGKPLYRFEAALRTERPGVATGVAWTPTGGKVLFVEAAIMPGKEGELILTGQLGDVMRESARIALSHVEAHMERLGLDREKGWKNQKIHLHVPAGAVPKDGPSAGITLTTALVSLLSGRSVRPDIAMTGEVTLQGQVLPVGGVKLKTLAAHRTGIKTLILPKLNEVDLDELPDEVREDMDFVLVEDVQEVLENALAPEKKPEKEEAPADLEAAKAKSPPAAERAPAPASP
ncbi:MAG: endopeptidase La [Chloroflexi bacterium]|jgi:ATP-dependent Lon protease|nr:endopeptidase La [Chloroflexota bacterium]